MQGVGRRASIKCFNCNTYGHYKNECPRPEVSDKNATSSIHCFGLFHLMITLLVGWRIEKLVNYSVLIVQGRFVVSLQHTHTPHDH